MLRFIRILLLHETQLAPLPSSGASVRTSRGDINEILTSPQLIGSYLGGLSSDAQDGITPQTSLKLNPSPLANTHVNRGSGAQSLTKKERHRHPLHPGRIEHPMHGRLERIIRHPHQKIPDIHHHRPLHRRRLDPLSLRRQHL